MTRPVAAEGRDGGLSFRARLTVALVVVAVVPVVGLGLAVIATEAEADDRLFVELLLGALVAGALIGLVMAQLVASALTRPLRLIASSFDAVNAGGTANAVVVSGEDELARLAESHNRIVTAAEIRNRALHALVDAVCDYGPGDGVDALVERATTDAREIFGFIDASVRLVPPASVPAEERVPGEPQPVRADVRTGTEPIGVFIGHVPATRAWERGDQDLVQLFASEVGVAIRNAELFERIERQNERLVELSAAKDEFLRTVSHNLQTPLTSIRAYAEQLRTTAADQTTAGRLDIIAEQSDRLTRLVRQLLTLSRLEAGALRPSTEVLSVAAHVRRAWLGLNIADVELALRDESRGWLAIADPDQLDQILWALLDNAVKYGGRAGPVEAAVSVDEEARRVSVTIADHGPGIGETDRAWLFTRFGRGPGQSSGEGTGLGLHVSRELARAMDGDLRLENAPEGWGAAFRLQLPAEPPSDEE